MFVLCACLPVCVCVFSRVGGCMDTCVYVCVCVCVCVHMYEQTMQCA